MARPGTTRGPRDAPPVPRPGTRPRGTARAAVGADPLGTGRVTHLRGTHSLLARPVRQEATRTGRSAHEARSPAASTVCGPRQRAMMRLIASFRVVASRS